MAKKDSSPKKAAKNEKKAVTKVAKKAPAKAREKAAPKSTKKPKAAANKATAKPKANAPKKKVPTKKAKATVTPAPLTHEDIVAEAQRIYQSRLEVGQPGDELSDWLAAEAALKAA